MKKAFFYGDSNTYGYDPAGYFGGRYPRLVRWTSIIKDRLAGAWEIAADGMPGRVIPSGRRALEYFRGSLRAEMPVDLFAVMLGTNDILGTRHPDAERTAGEMEDLIAGICSSVAVRVGNLAKRINIVPDVCMSGGVAQNAGVRNALSQSIGQPILFSPKAQLFGAIGAALYAYQKQVKK